MIENMDAFWSLWRLEFFTIVAFFVGGLISGIVVESNQSKSNDTDTGVTIFFIATIVGLITFALMSVGIVTLYTVN